MREPAISPVVRYSANLKKLLGITKLTVAKVAELAKVQPKQVYNLMGADHDFRIKSMEKVAGAFGLSAWQMLVMDLEESPPSNKQVLALLELYSRADESGRKTIMQVAEIAAAMPPR